MLLHQPQEQSKNQDFIRGSTQINNLAKDAERQGTVLDFYEIGPLITKSSILKIRPFVIKISNMR